MKVFSNLAISLDGKIADLSEPKKYLGTPLDRKVMQQIRKKADAIIVGAQTLRVHPHCYKVKAAKCQPVNVILTQKGDLPSDIPFWQDDGVVRFVFTTQAGQQKAEKAAKERAFVEVCGEDSIDPSLVLERLKKSGLKNILIEGGGEIMALFLKSQLIDELYVTLTPWILGGRQNPSLVGGEGLVPWTSLQIKSLARKKNEVYFRFAVRKQK